MRSGRPFMEDRRVIVMEERDVVVTEKYGHSLMERDFKVSPDGSLQMLDKSPRHTGVSHFFRAFASSVSGTLAAHSLLQGMGVGDENATVLAATMTWLLKDGTGMLGRIVFAWMKGHMLDCDAKRWRLFADILNDIAIFLEIMAPVFQSYFRLVVCVAGVAKSLVGVAGGATRAALTQHQARRNNMADVSAKDGSQETLVNLSALLVSLVLLPVVSGQQMLTYTIFFLLTFLHLFANYRAVKSVCMESLNQARLHLIVRHYLTTGQVPVAQLVNKLEPVIFPIRRRLKVDLGASFSQIHNRGQYEFLRRAYAGISSHYLLHYDKRKGAVTIVLEEQSVAKDQLQACVHAEVLDFLGSRQAFSNTLQAVPTDIDLEDEEDAVRRTYLAVERLFPHFLHSLAAVGWCTDSALLGADEWRAWWCFDGQPDKKKHF